MLFNTRSERLGIIITLLAALVMGFYPPAVRAVYADGGNVVFMLLATIWTRALSLALFCFLKRKPLFQTKEDRRQAFVGGFCQSISSSGVIIALAYTPGPLVVLITYLSSLLLFFFLVWKGEAQLNALTLVTTVVALIGISITLDVWHRQPPGYLLGGGIAFIASLAIVYRLYVYGHETKTRDPAIVGAENFLVAATIVTLILFYKVPHAPQSLGSYGWVVLACISMAAGTFCMFYGISHIGSFGYSLFAKTEPVFTCLFSVWLIDEVLKTEQYLGMALVVGSLVFYQLSKRAHSVPAAES